MRITRHLFGLIVAGILVVLAGDWLLYDHTPGWNLALFFLAAAVAAALRGGAFAGTRAARGTAAALFGLLIALAAQPGPLVFLMSFAALLAFADALREGKAPDAVGWLSRIFVFGVKLPFQAAIDLWLLRRWVRSGRGRLAEAGARKLLRNWSIPVAGSFFFTGLFLIANPVLSHEFDSFLTSLETWTSQWRFDLPRTFFCIAIGTGAWALLRVRTLIARRAPAAPAPSIPMSETRTGLLVRCLVLFNAVFALQTVMDVLFLWGGRALPDGMSYAEYAHRGAYPLVATAVLAALFVLAAYRSGPPTVETSRARRLVLLWLAQNVFLTFSAAWRLHLYAQVYGLTRLRVAAAVWMLLVALGLAWIGLRILGGRSNRWLVNRNLATLALVLYFCCFVNFEGMIAWHNARNCAEAGGPGGMLDPMYLLALGPEAMPAAQWLKDSGRYHFSCDIQYHLQVRLNDELSDWRGWTYRRMVLWNGLQK